MWEAKQRWWVSLIILQFSLYSNVEKRKQIRYEITSDKCHQFKWRVSKWKRRASRLQYKSLWNPVRMTDLHRHHMKNAFATDTSSSRQECGGTTEKEREIIFVIWVTSFQHLLLLLHLNSVLLPDTSLSGQQLVSITRLRLCKRHIWIKNLWNVWNESG